MAWRRRRDPEEEESKEEGTAEQVRVRGSGVKKQGEKQRGQRPNITSGVGMVLSNRVKINPKDFHSAD